MDSVHSPEPVELESRDVPALMSPLIGAQPPFPGFDLGEDLEELAVPHLAPEGSPELRPANSRSQRAIKSRKITYDVEDLLN